MSKISKDAIDYSIKFIERLSLVAGITAGTVLIVHHAEIAPNHFLLYLACYLLVGLALIVTILSALDYADDLGKAIDKPLMRNLTTILVYTISVIVGVQVIIWTAKIANFDIASKDSISAIEK